MKYIYLDFVELSNHEESTTPHSKTNLIYYYNHWIVSDMIVDVDDSFSLKSKKYINWILYYMLSNYRYVKIQTMFVIKKYYFYCKLNILYTCYNNSYKLVSLKKKILKYISAWRM